MKNIYYQHGKYRLRKYKDGKYGNYGVFDTLELAQQAREVLDKIQWDIQDKTITFKHDGEYHVIARATDYHINGVTFYAGSAKTIEELHEIMDNPLRERFMYTNHKGWNIARYVKGKLIVVAYIDDYETAIAIRDYAVQCEWELPTHTKPYIIHIREMFYLLRIQEGNIRVLDKNKDKNKLQAVDMANIYKSGGVYHVRRVVDKESENFLTYPTLDEAISMRDFLREHNWDRSEFEKEYERRYPQLPQYIYFEGGRYVVKRFWKGMVKAYGTYHTLTEAVSAVKYLEEHDWKARNKLNVINIDGRFYVYRRLSRGYCTPFKEFYTSFDNRGDAERLVDKYRVEGFPTPFCLTNKYRYITRNYNLYYVMRGRTKLCYAYTMRDALVARDICEWLGMQSLVEGEYSFDGSMYHVVLNSFGTPVFERG